MESRCTTTNVETILSSQLTAAQIQSDWDTEHNPDVRFPFPSVFVDCYYSFMANSRLAAIHQGFHLYFGHWRASNRRNGPDCRYPIN